MSLDMNDPQIAFLVLSILGILFFGLLVLVAERKKDK